MATNVFTRDSIEYFTYLIESTLQAIEFHGSEERRYKRCIENADRSIENVTYYKKWYEIHKNSSLELYHEYKDLKKKRDSLYQKEGVNHA